MPAFKESDGKPAFPSAEEVRTSFAGHSIFPCRVQAEEPGKTWGPYEAASSHVGGPTAWTFHMAESQRPGSPGGVDVTIKISPL